VELPLDPPPRPPPPPPFVEPPPRRAPGNPAAFFLALVVLFVLPGAASQRLSTAAGLAWTQVFAFLLPAWISARGSNLVPARALLLARAPPAGALPVAVIAGAVAFFAGGAAMALVSSALPRGWVEAFDVSRLFDGPPLERLALAGIASVLAPFCEEVAFRGHLLTLLGARLRAGAAIAVSALLFAALHLDPVRFVAVFLLGLLYGWITWRAGSLWPAVGAHVANNSIGAALVLAAGEQASRAEPRPVAALVAMLLALGALLPLLGWYRRLTPSPPPLEAALAPADPADPDPRFRAARAAGAIGRWALAGAALLLAIAAAARGLGR
jgi:membrane protease YdiL (CAAX protease family)